MEDKYNKVGTGKFERVRTTEDKDVVTLEQVDHLINMKQIEVDKVQNELKDLKKLRKDLASL